MPDKTTSILKVYLFVLRKVIEFKIKRHPYMFAWFLIWFVSCMWYFIARQDAFWLVWFLFMIAGVFVCRKLYEIGSSKGTLHYKVLRSQENQEMKTYVKEEVQKRQLK